MKPVFFLFSAYMTGFLAAVPAGPVQIEVVRRSINGHMHSSFMVIAGALAADIIYGVIALFGIAPFLQKEIVMAVFWLAGSCLLIFLGTVTIRQSLSGGAQNSDSSYLRKKRWGFIGGFSLAAANPMMILWWLIAVKLFKDIKLIQSVTPDVAVSFIAAGGSGLASYLILLSAFLYWAKRFISEHTIIRVNITTGVVLLGIALYFLYSSLRSIAGLF
ncbi:MAG: hypothetical protein AMK70_04335 [Nitrospira bacterium SG8_35_1]|nr:MAG: hypothetical protein AMK70_04335 [Nitrospira bacterium SG8_35_1]